MQDVMKFGVKWQRALDSECLSTLITVDANAAFDDILNLTLCQFSASDAASNLRNFCFLMKDDNGKASMYITEENVELLDRNLLYLVQVPAIASEQAIQLLNNELKLLDWNHTQCQTLITVLQELAKLLPCRQFATEFLKNGGREAIFQLVEKYPVFDPHQTVYFVSGSVNSPDPNVWSTLVACLAELSEYSINSTGGLTEENQDGGNNDSALFPDINPSDSFMQSVSELVLNEVFSWHLASERFLSVLVTQCAVQTELEPLRDGLKVLLKILINCPVRADSIIPQLSPEFIFSQFRKVHDSSPVAASSPPALVNNALGGSATRLMGSRRSSGTFSVPASCASSPCSRAPSFHVDPSTLNVDTTTWLNQLIPELNCILLDMIYLILHRSRQLGHLAEVMPSYLNAPNLRMLATFTHSELRNHCNIRTSSPNIPQERASTLKRISDSGPLGLPRFSSTLHRQNSTYSGGHSIFFFPDPTVTTSTPSSQRFKSSRYPNQPSRTEEDVIDSLHRLQNIQFIYLKDQLNIPADDESTAWSEKLQKLCQLCSSHWTPMDRIDRPSELHYSQLGFKFPKTPQLDFASPPGLLGYQCLYSFLTHCGDLKREILNYGRVGLLAHSSTSLLRPSLWSSSLAAKSYVRKQASQCTQNTKKDELGGPNPYISLPHMTLSSEDHAESHGATPPNTPMKAFHQTRVTETVHSRPLFPLVESANALVLTLYEVLDIDATSSDLLSPPGSSSLRHCSGRFYPMLFQPRANDLLPFEELFLCTFPVFFYSWTQLNACPDDLDLVLSVLREQLSQTLLRNPVSLDEFEEQLSRFTPQIIRSIWREQEERSRRKMMQSHPALRELHVDLTKAHELNVREQRLNALTYRAPLEYIPQKSTRQFGRDNQKLEVVLSCDRKSLVLRDTKQCVRELWPLVCVDRVSTGTEEKVKKNPERSLVLHMRIRESPEPLQILLTARSDLDYKYWLDGFHILLRRGIKSDQFDADVRFLVDLDMKIRLCSLDSIQLPTGPLEIPPDPPEFDFDEDCEI